MSIENDIFSALKTLVGNRISPDIFPQPPAVPTWPAIRYTIISDVPFSDLCGDGDEDTPEKRVQFDLVASTFAAVRSLRLQVRAAMKMFDPPCLLEISSSEFDAETKTYREIMDYSFHASSDSGNSPP